MEKEEAAVAEMASEKGSSSGKPENQQQARGKKRKRDGGPYQDAYKFFTFQPIPSSGRPGTPHRFFAGSYSVEQEGEPGTATGMRVHQHANGLCIVTAGDTTTTSKPSGDIHFQAEETPEMSAAAKRKRSGAMLKGKVNNKQSQETTGIVYPSDLLVTVGDGDEQQYPCCVFGSLLELNRNLTADLLQTDPLLKGYLAVILPSGPFPPPCDSNADNKEAVAAEVDTS